MAEGFQDGILSPVKPDYVEEMDMLAKIKKHVKNYLNHHECELATLLISKLYKIYVALRRPGSSKLNPVEITKASEYLSGKKFSSGLALKIPSNDYLDLKEFISDYVRNKKVLHIGFADHPEIIDKKIKNDGWFHLHIMNSAKEAFGVDLNCMAVEYVKRTYNIPNVYCGNIENVDEIPKEIDKVWDAVLILDVIEHVDNPISFLKSVKDNLRFKELIVSAPNALRIENFVNAKKNLEVNNTDHRYWFSPYTLSKIITISGFNIRGILMIDRYRKRSFRKCKNPLFRDTVIIIAK